MPPPSAQPPRAQTARSAQPTPSRPADTFPPPPSPSPPSAPPSPPSPPSPSPPPPSPSPPSPSPPPPSPSPPSPSPPPLSRPLDIRTRWTGETGIYTVYFTLACIPYSIYGIAYGTVIELIYFLQKNKVRPPSSVVDGRVQYKSAVAPCPPRAAPGALACSEPPRRLWLWGLSGSSRLFMASTKGYWSSTSTPLPSPHATGGKALKSRDGRQGAEVTRRAARR